MGEKFLSRAHQFFPPKSGGKSRKENWAECSFTRMLSPLTLFIQDFHLTLFIQDPSEDFCPNNLSPFLIFFSLPSQHAVHCSRFSPLFFFHEPLKQCLCKLIINFILFHKINLIFFPDSFEQIERNLEKLIKITFKLLH